jgi:hypothetical protein
MLPFHRPLNPLLALLIEHMMTKVIQLHLIRARRKIRARDSLKILQTGAQGGDDLICLDALSDDFAQREEALLHVLHGPLAEEQVNIVGGPVLVGQHRRENFGRDVVRFDDASGPPDLHHSRIVDLPLVLLIGCIDDVQALDEASQAGGVDALAQRLEELRFLGLVQLDLLRREATAHGLFGGGEAEGMSGAEGRRVDVPLDSFGVGPDACAFFTRDVLDRFVGDGGKDQVVGGVAFVGEVGADGDGVCAALVEW